MKLKGLFLYFGIAILAVIMNYRFQLNVIEFIFWLVAIICINIGTTWEE